MNDAADDYSLTFADVAGPIWGIEQDNTLVRTHGPAKCAGRPCCIHHPSDHHMKAWPLVIRFDRGITERTCPHGIGHPDPDDAAYRRTLPGDYDSGVHGCDGCCYDGNR